MNKFIFCLVLSVCLSFAANCAPINGPFNNETREVFNEEGFGMCSCEWYQRDGNGICCPSSYSFALPDQYQFVDKVSTGLMCAEKKYTRVNPCKDANNNCADLWNLASCGKSCSPKQGDFYDSTAGFMMCEDFAKKLFDSCKDQEYWNETAWKCSKPYSDMNYTSFAATAGFSVDGNDKCFNAASSTSAFAAVAVAALGSVAGFRNPLFLTLVLLTVAPLLVSAKCVKSGVTYDAAPVEYMSACQWYSEKQCCDADFAVGNPQNHYNYGYFKPGTVKPKYGCKELSPSCRDWIDFSACSKCSPKEDEIRMNQSTTYGSIVICEKTAADMYKACKDDLTYDDVEGKCRKIADKWDDEVKFAAYLGFSTNETEASSCWSASSLSTVSIAIIAIVGLLNMF